MSAEPSIPLLDRELQTKRRRRRASKNLTLHLQMPTYTNPSPADSVITSPRLLNLPLLLVVNKQDQPSALSVAEVRESFEAFQRAALEADAAAGEKEDGMIKAERVATLDVLGMSALTGYVPAFQLVILGRWADLVRRDGVKDAIEWLYSRVQTARRM
jgi:ADP-ribosylation factor related protein 1